MDTVWSLVVGPLVEYGFMRYGLAVAVVVGVTSAILSCLLVVRRWALLGDAISHAALLGVTVGWIAAGQAGIFWGALIAGVLTGMGITYIDRNSRVKDDAAMGVLFTFAFALGIAIISMARPRGIDLFHILFGNVLGVGRSDLALTAASGGLVLLTMLLLYKPFHLWTFDPVMARAMGLPVGLLHYVFMAMLSATIVASLQAVGLVLVIAMLITPGATAYLLAERLATMMLVAALLGLLSAVGGLYGSFYLDVASGPAMVLLASAFFAVAFAFAPKRGLVVRKLRRRRAVRRAAQEEPATAACGTVRAPAVGDVPAHVEGRGRKDHSVPGGPLSSDPHGRALLTHPDALVGPEPDGDPSTTQPCGLDGLGPIAGRTLMETPIGSSGRVLMVDDDRVDVLDETAALGIRAGTTVRVLSRNGDWMGVGLHGRVRVAVRSDIASRVYVHVEPTA